MRIWLAVVVVAGCYQPQLQTGSPCDDAHPCPSGLVCATASSTCQVTDGPIDASSDDAEILIDGCTPAPEICGDGIDQDCNGSDPACAANDAPGGAIDITAGGDFSADVRYATDDAQKPNTGTPACGGVGGRDVYYKVHLTADEAYYIDTFGSNFDTVLRVYHGVCAAGVAPNGTDCHNNQCSTLQTQGIFDLLAGDTCIVVDQASNAETKGNLTLHVERGHRSGLAIAAVVTGNTTGGTDQSTPPCNNVTGNDVGYYFTGCPGGVQAVTATTCNATTLFDTSLYARSYPAGTLTELACNDDDAACIANTGASTISFAANGAHLFWIIMDAGSDGAAGPFEVDTTFN